MSRPWNRPSNSSPGFVYFSQETQKESGDTGDFLSFQESPKQNYNNTSPNYGSPKFHSSPRQYNMRNNYRYSGRHRTNNRPYNSPNSYNKSWNNHNSPKHSPYKRGSLFHNVPMMSADGKRDMSLFYDHTCTLNPWKDLEEKLEKERLTQKYKDDQLSTVSKNKEQEQSSSSDDDNEDNSNEEESSNSEEDDEEAT